MTVKYNVIYNLSPIARRSHFFRGVLWVFKRLLIVAAGLCNILAQQLYDIFLFFLLFLSNKESQTSPKKTKNKIKKPRVWGLIGQTANTVLVCHILQCMLLLLTLHIFVIDVNLFKYSGIYTSMPMHFMLPSVRVVIIT